MSKFSEHWESRDYEDIESCSRVDANKTLQEVVTRRFREALTRRMQRQIGRVDNVFDIGCGTGEWIRGYLSFCGQANGIDANLAFLEEARRRLSDVEHRVDLWHGDALDFEYFEDVRFVSFGASLMYFGDSECRRILEKIAEAQKEEDWVYIRATVADPWGEAFETEGGAYRLKSTYDRLFETLGYRTIICEHSITIVMADLLGSIMPVDSDTLGPLLEPAIRPLRWSLRKDTSFCNWLLQKR